MKIKILILLMIFPLVYICCTRDDLQNEMYDQLKCDKLINEPYNFPVKPGDPEWGDLKTEEERINAVQIPDSILRCLTDEALIQTCINYPLYPVLICSSDTDPLKSFEKFIVNNFNGLQELYERKNIETILLDRYISEDMYSFVKRYDALKLHYFFMFLAGESVISELKKDEVYYFIKHSLDKFDTIQNVSPPYYAISINN